MARLDRYRKSPNSLVASAAILPDARLEDPQTMDWQVKLWHFYESIGEFRRGIDWIAAACSRCRLVAAQRPIGKDDDPIPLEDGPAVEMMAEFAGGPGGQAQLIETAAVHLGVPGETYYVGYDDPNDNQRKWEAHSADEIRTRGKLSYELRRGESDWLKLGEDSHIVRVWRANRRFAWRADSPAKTMQPILREIELSTDYIQSALISRLAGAGILVIPDELVFPASDKHQGQDGDPFVLDLIEAMVTPIRDSNSASRHVPMVVRVPGAFVDKVKHIRFAAPFDEKAIEQRDNAINRLAASMELEQEQLTGMGEVNHWGQWEIKESTLQLAVSPLMESICHGLTVGWMWPGLGALGNAPDMDTIVWFETTELDVKPDKSQQALEAYDRGEASGEAVRRELGLSEDDRPTGQDLTEWALKQLLKNSATAPIALAGLGIMSPEDIKEVQPAPPELGPGDGDVQDAESEELPQDGPPDSNESQPAEATAVTASLLEACDGIVDRAMERGGRRLTQVAKGMRISCRPQDAHLAIDAQALTNLRQGYLLEGAWERVPAVAARHGVDPKLLQKALHLYCDTLINQQKPHHIETLTLFLRSEPWLTPTG